MTPSIRTTAIDAWGEAGGPLPRFPPGNIVATRFWSGYQNPALPATFAGQRGSIAARAFRAGRKRRRAEPGIDPATDSRARAPAE